MRSYFIYILFFALFLNVKVLYGESEYTFIEFFDTAEKLQKNLSSQDKFLKESLLNKTIREVYIANDQLLLLEAAINKDKMQIQNNLDRAKRSNNTTLILLEELKMTQIDIKLIVGDWLGQFHALKQGRYNQEDITFILNSVETSLNSIQFESYEVQIVDLSQSNQVMINQQLDDIKQEIQTYKEILEYLRANSALLIDGYLLHTLAIDSVIKWLDQFYPIEFWRISFGKLVICAVVLFVFWSLRRLLARWTVKLIAIVFRHDDIGETQNTIIATLIRPISWFLFFNGFDICLDVIYYPENSLEWMGRFFDIVYVISIAWFMVILIECYGAIFLIKLSQHRHKKIRAEIINLLLKFLYFGISAIALLVILARLDFNISAIIASLGIGGLAVALAAKDILANFFASVMLLFDNAFSQGDWITCGSIEGTVVEIGLRRTSIRTFDNALLFVPNSLLVGSAIYNWNRRKVGRRIKMNLGLTYNARADQIDQCIKDIKTMLETHPSIAKKSDYDSASALLSLKQDIVSVDDVEGNKSAIAVYLDNFGDSSIDIVVSCFSVAVTQLEWSQTKQNIMFEMMRIIERNGLSFAFPSQSVYIENVPLDFFEKITDLHKR